MLNIWNVNTYICTDKWLKNADSNWQLTHPTSRQRGCPTDTTVIINSNKHLVMRTRRDSTSRHNDWLTDRPSLVTWLWLCDLIKLMLVLHQTKLPHVMFTVVSTAWQHIQVYRKYKTTKYWQPYISFVYRQRKCSYLTITCLQCNILFKFPYNCYHNINYFFVTFELCWWMFHRNLLQILLYKPTYPHQQTVYEQWEQLGYKLKFIY
jgi:hypothetical protein